MHCFRNSEIILTKDNSQKLAKNTKRSYSGRFQELPETEIMCILFCAWGGYSELLGSAVTNVWWWAVNVVQEGLHCDVPTA